MAYAVIGIFAFIVGSLVVFVLTERKRKEVAAKAAEIASEWHRMGEAKSELTALRAASDTLFQEEQIRLAKLATEQEVRFDTANKEQGVRFDAINREQTERLARISAEWEQRIIKYSELEAENKNLKSIQRALAQNVRKHDLDHRTQQGTLEEQLRQTNELAKRYLSENVKWIAKGINANNYAASKQKLLDVIARCRSIGFEVTEGEEAVLLNDLKQEFEKAVRAAMEREEQARIKAQIREELLREREVQRELDRIGREKAAIEAALAVALTQARGEHDAEVENLRARLADAEASQRAVSQAQLTKAGFVYVISNIGSFGEDVFKIGMTRRLTPLDRVRELGDASVPFPFDVHMMISTDNAPELERLLHKAFYKRQVNRVNPRKEFFRVTLEEIAVVVRECHGEIEYIADAEALDYRQSLSMSDVDQEYIEHVYEEFDENDVDALEPLVDPA